MKGTLLALVLNCGFLLLFVAAQAQEQPLDLDQEVPAPALPARTVKASKWNLMGRVDLTSETAAVDRSRERTHTLENNHFLVFLKVQASDKVHFMGELVQQSFFYVEYAARDFVDFQFGKIMVPFGDTRRFHHFYGGVQGLKGQGIMFPNVWAESGLNLRWKWNSQSLETYWVDSIEDDSLTADPDLKSQVEPRELQAGGLRWTTPLTAKWTLLVSGYRGEYQAGKALEIAGLDIYSEYGAWGLQDWRWAAGIANAWIHRAPVSGDFQKRGDYLEIVSRSFGIGETRLRYGTYLDNNQATSQNDTHSLALGTLMPVDVMNVLVEYQWNFEAVNEKNNDTLRVMVSLDF